KSIRGPPRRHRPWRRDRLGSSSLSGRWRRLFRTIGKPPARVNGAECPAARLSGVARRNSVLCAALFAATAGYIDAVCYFLLGASFGAGTSGAFAANMTGNLVEVGINAAQGYWARALWLGAILVAYLVGVAAARAVLWAGGSSRLLVLIEAGLIALAA